MGITDTPIFVNSSTDVLEGIPTNSNALLEQPSIQNSMYVPIQRPQTNVLHYIIKELRKVFNRISMTKVTTTIEDHPTIVIIMTMHIIIIINNCIYYYNIVISFMCICCFS